MMTANELIDLISPLHDRHSCNDNRRTRLESNPETGFLPGCVRCFLLDIADNGVWPKEIETPTISFTFKDERLVESK